MTRDNPVVRTMDVLPKQQGARIEQMDWFRTMRTIAPTQLLYQFLLLISLSGLVHAQQLQPIPEDPVQSPVNVNPDTLDDALDADEEDDLDDLLDLADKDVGNLSQVQVAPRSQPLVSAPAATEQPPSQLAPTLNTPVSTVERKQSTVGKTAAAVFVITNEMIRRSGARSAPEALRMAPGVQVARIDANKWSISMRGFNSRFSNKLLVQIDGRSVYNPLFGGMFWDAQTVLLEDVERIEVIRGPGGTVWGANAVNGVINVVSKHARDTVGTFFQAGGGNFERAFTSFRHGWQSEQETFARVYGQWLNREAFRSPTDHDDWRIGRAGGRVDWSVDDTDHYTLQGDYYQGTAGTNAAFASPLAPFALPRVFDERIRGGNVLFRMVHNESEDENYQFQAYYDLTQRSFDGQGFNYERHTVDLDFQHRWKPYENHDVIWGLGYRAYWDETQDQPFFLSLDPQNDNYDIFGGFIQDTITLSDDELFLTLGTKISNNDFTGTEFQPSARLLWTPARSVSVWAAASRAVRTATRVTRDARLILPGTATPIGAVFPTVNGTRGVEAEDVFALEFGLREQPRDWFSYDLAVFGNWYTDLVGLSAPLGLAPGPEGLTSPLAFTNSGSATSYGFELAANYEMSDTWMLRGAYTFLRLDFDGSVLGNEDDSPRNQIYLQSSHDLGEQTELDLMWRYVDNLPSQNVNAYSAFDARLGWWPTENLEIFAVGQNLFDSDHFEFGNDVLAGARATQVPRGFYAGLSLRF